MKPFIITVICLLFCGIVRAQNYDRLIIYGDFVYFKTKIATDARAFKKIDSLEKLPDSAQVIKIEMGGDYDFYIRYERFYYNGHHWSLDSGAPIKLLINIPALSQSFLESNNRSEHDHYLRFQNNRSTSHLSYLYFLIVKGKIIKSLDSSVPIEEISPYILSDDSIFYVFN